jgi:hypothetical protein
VLYGAGELFACRNCHELAYESQRALSRSPRSTIRPRSARPASADRVGSFTGPLVVGSLVAFGLSTAGIFVANPEDVIVQRRWRPVNRLKSKVMEDPPRLVA